MAPDDAARLQRQIEALQRELDELHGDHMRLTVDHTRLAGVVGAHGEQLGQGARAIDLAGRKTWLDRGLSGLGILGLVAVLAVLTGKASSQSLTVAESRITQVERTQSAQTEILSGLGRSQIDTTKAIDKLSDKIDGLSKSLAPKRRGNLP